ncbi:hypothetical protein VTK26DRAFT_2602 [Humicola hyalothermophila]
MRIFGGRSGEMGGSGSAAEEELGCDGGRCYGEGETTVIAQTGNKDGAGDREKLESSGDFERCLAREPSSRQEGGQSEGLIGTKPKCSDGGSLLPWQRSGNGKEGLFQLPGANPHSTISHESEPGKPFLRDIPTLHPWERLLRLIRARLQRKHVHIQIDGHLDAVQLLEAG